MFNTIYTTDSNFFVPHQPTVAPPRTAGRREINALRYIYLYKKCGGVWGVAPVPAIIADKLSFTE